MEIEDEIAADGPSPTLRRTSAPQQVATVERDAESEASAERRERNAERRERRQQRRKHGRNR